ncbi:MAG: hypothetical protein INF12_14510 [Methylobacterium sp.]|nr:hypothetical protein [Methylobacterium sp.]
MFDKLTPGRLRDLASLIWGNDLPIPKPHQMPERALWEIAEGLRNSAAYREKPMRRKLLESAIAATFAASIVFFVLAVIRFTSEVCK